MKKQLVLSIFLILIVSQIYAEGSSVSQAARYLEEFNQNWKFTPHDIAWGYSKWCNTSKWQDAVLPHTPRIESLVQADQWQGICWYRKNFKVSEEHRDKKVFVQFEAAMQTASVWVNENPLYTHEGGYLPFTIDITDVVDFQKENTIAIRLNNYNSSVIPPAKPVEGLDFYYYGGLYRGAHLLITDKVHITDAVRANRVASGGVFVTTPHVSEELSVVKIKTHILNEEDWPQSCKIRTTILDAENKPVAGQLSYVMTMKAGEDASFEQSFSVKNPALWSPWSPSLYHVKSEVIKGKDVCDIVMTRFGIRSIRFSKEDGFQINGKTFYFRGINRHEQYPYIGNALSRNAQYRDAQKIKEAGYDYVRLSHYPHSPDFMDACDELGLMVMDCIPGWQSMGAQRFKELCYQNCRDLIRRDRNHPCVILWEVSLNETGMDKDYIEVSNKIAHEEYPGDQCYTCGWQGQDYDVYIQARQHRLKGKGSPKTDKPYLVSEYGDWEFYAIEKRGKGPKFRPPEETSRQFRGDGQKRMLRQVMNFQEAFNDNRANTPAIGDGLWVMYDYNRGKFEDLESSGIMDIFRLPKFSYYFYRSQRSPKENFKFADTGPMVFIASYWNEHSPKDVKVFSNCGQVALYVNGELIEKRSPDQTDHTSQLPHPPFTFTLEKFTAGTLKAVGYIDGVEAADHLVQTPQEAVALTIKPDLSRHELAADGADVIFVYASVVDENGTVVPDEERNVTFSVEGPAKLIGDNPIRAEAGIATILLQATSEPGRIQIQAKTDGLQDGQYTLSSK